MLTITKENAKRLAASLRKKALAQLTAYLEECFALSGSNLEVCFLRRVPSASHLAVYCLASKPSLLIGGYLARNGLL